MRISDWSSDGCSSDLDDPVYVKSTCFDPFPLPADVPKPLQGNIRDQAEALDALRQRVLESHQDLTLTRLYNVLEALKQARSSEERRVGKECVSTGRFRGGQCNEKKKKK